MISYLSGLPIAKTDRNLTLNVNGVGYKVSAPMPLLNKIELDLPLELHIYTNVREDEISLYGFETPEQLRLFELFISVNGVGPRLGMDLFATPLEKTKHAIRSGNVAALTQIPGIGKKTAERLIVELKDKIEMGIGSSEHPSTSMAQDPTSTVPEDVSEALENLGYKPKDIHRVFRSLKEPIEKPEEMIKYFLKNV